MKTRLAPLVLLDTSFILTLQKSHKEFDEEIRKVIAGPLRIATTEGVIMELQRLSRSGRFGTAGLAKVALGTLEERKIDVLDTSPAIPEVDTSILAIALGNKGEAMVATVDRQLRDILARHRLAVISPRGRMGLLVSRSPRPVPLK